MPVSCGFRSNAMSARLGSQSVPDLRLEQNSSLLPTEHTTLQFLAVPFNLQTGIRVDPHTGNRLKQTKPAFADGWIGHQGVPRSGLSK